MTQLTKEQRHEVYKKALEIFTSEDYNKNWCCEAIRDACIYLGIKPNSRYYMYGDYTILLPEFLSKKPKKAEYVWFNYKFGKEPRIKILTQCINETKP